VTISFDEIPLTLRTPGTYLEVDPTFASSGIALVPLRGVLLGQRRSSGAVAAGVPTTITSGSQAADAFGVGSQLHRMALAWLGANPTGEILAVALDEAGGAVQATGTIDVTGTPTGGILPLYIGGERLLVSSGGGTAAAVASAIAEAITNRPELPLTGQTNPGDDQQVILTARHAGEAGNAIDVRTAHLPGEVVPAGITVTITGLAGGAGNPDVGNALTALAGEDVDVIVHPYVDAGNLTTLEAELETRAEATQGIPGVAITATTGTAGILANLGDGRNSPYSCIVGLETMPAVPEEVAAAVGGLVAFHGGSDPARPFQTLELDRVLAPSVEDRFTLTDRELLLHDGISTLEATRDGRVLIERLITTYQETPQGSPDEAFLNLNTMLLLKLTRRSFAAHMHQKFPRAKVKDDGENATPGVATLTPQVAKAEARAWYGDLMDLGLVEDPEGFLANSQFLRDPQDPDRLNVRLAPNYVNQLRIVAVKLSFRN